MELGLSPRITLKTGSAQEGEGDCHYLEAQALCVMGIVRTLTTYLLPQSQYSRPKIAH